MKMRKHHAFKTLIIFSFFGWMLFPDHEKVVSTVANLIWLFADDL